MGCGASHPTGSTDVQIHPELLPSESKDPPKRWMRMPPSKWVHLPLLRPKNPAEVAVKSPLGLACNQGEVALTSMIKAVKRGTEETAEYRLYFEDGRDNFISPWHDIPLYPPRQPGLLNFVVEIPRGTRAKLEVATGEKANPIKQDTKHGKLRYYGIEPIFNYGCLPQTWEDPAVKHEDANCVGDGDPVDVVEIGEKALPSGTVVQIKPLGILCMIDDGEADWKVIAINKSDPKAADMDDIGDVDKVMPGTVSAIREWFRTYKTHEGKPLNSFGLNEEARGRMYTLKIVQLAHDDWAKLWMGSTKIHKAEVQF